MGEATKVGGFAPREELHDPSDYPAQTLNLRGCISAFLAYALLSKHLGASVLASRLPRALPPKDTSWRYWTGLRHTCTIGTNHPSL